MRTDNCRKLQWSKFSAAQGFAGWFKKESEKSVEKPNFTCDQHKTACVSDHEICDRNLCSKPVGSRNPSKIVCTTQRVFNVSHTFFRSPIIKSAVLCERYREMPLRCSTLPANYRYRESPGSSSPVAKSSGCSPDRR